MAFIKEFKEFAMRGNVVDLAVGVVIGAAFGKIVTSLVADVIMPPIGYITGGVDFSDKKIVLKEADPAHKVLETAIHYGSFINAIIQFIIIAFCIFLVVKAINSLKKEEEAPAAPADPEPTKEEILLTEIRDLLAKKA
ncbi:large-conductance mechanosensitive channel protein MscL [Mucilaginibacter sp. X4EP1]|uniref:large-conductance mechanosensitive channel protein MscL n=1 Tax=Mucilaginibacter sp. X4EP1 TaxID=2723092 RepID=UPI002169ADB5|nr:large-conductance mechanosensitive channel protein MscL [Mucilaginibacter sp. X4EP1]MCS3815730.1 large conductance mechanosensitive channel [Mucilaginibacter sp. X4EP1]